MDGQTKRTHKLVRQLADGTVKVFNPHTDPLPKWVKQGVPSHRLRALGFTCDDHSEQAFATDVMMLTGFSIPEFDAWLESLGLCGARADFMIRRRKAAEALAANDEPQLRAHLEWMTSRRTQIERELAIAPVVRTGAKVRKPFAQANLNRRDRSRAHWEEMQLKAEQKWSEPQHARKSASAIAQLIDPNNWNVTRRHIKRPT